MASQYKRNPGSRGAARVSEADHAERLITFENKRPHLKTQAVAIARAFGRIGIGVFVRDLRTETRVGLFDDTGDAAAAAESLNLRFQTAGAAT